MKSSGIALVLAAAIAAPALLVASTAAQTTPAEQDIIDAPKKPSDESGEFTNVRSLSGDRGVTVTGGEKTVPSIDLKVNFAFDSARLDNESLLTLDVLGRALTSEELKGQAIEIVGHTDAKGTLEYNDALSLRRAAAVVTYIVPFSRWTPPSFRPRAWANASCWTRTVPKRPSTGASRSGT